jgi:putative transposase
MNPTGDMDSSGRDGIGRDGSPSRPNSSLGESALPSALPTRQTLIHTTPPWVPEGSTFFITINGNPRGHNQLANPAIALMVEESLLVRIEKGYWWPRLILLMPDHLHSLTVFSPGQVMVKVISDWKRYLARHAHLHWQRDFFDHRIRNEASLQEKWHYILQNPVRAGLVTAADQWPYSWINGVRLGLGRDGLGRDGSPSRPSNLERGALGESALPKTPKTPTQRNDES